MEYYWNNVPGAGLCRNNLIYTSLISKDEKTFCQWYYNDEKYHGDQNQVVDATLMQEKFDREVEYLLLMQQNCPQYIPEIICTQNKSERYDSNEEVSPLDQHCSAAMDGF